MRYDYIDVLKAIAIISVVLYHSGYMTFGYLGVDVFLVIAGYFTTKSLIPKIFGAKDVTWGGYFSFEINRVGRLLPLLLLAGGVCMTFGYFAMLPDDYENLSQSVVATNLFGNNILAALTTKNYWNIVNEYKPLMHTWYVGLLMQFYIVIPLLFLLARLDKKNPQNTMLVMTCVLGIISLLCYFGTTNTSHRFYYLPFRFYEFSVGSIIAMTWKPGVGLKPFHKWFVYVCYLLLIMILSYSGDAIPANVKVVTVVGLTAVLIMSNSSLDNKITANNILAKIGAASYSVFVWHQIVLAFYRYSYSSHFTIVSYSLLILAVGVLSWLTYKYVERPTGNWLKMKKARVRFLMLTVVALFTLTAFASCIYVRAGVVRDVPELYISKNSTHRGLHADYCDRIYQFDKPFETNRPHWLIIGNSFGRDFANVILESAIADSVEISYLFMEPEMAQVPIDRFSKSDLVFLSAMGANEETVSKIDAILLTNGLSPEQLVVVGTKNFGYSNGQFYSKRSKDNYFLQHTKMQTGYIEQNEKMKKYCGNRYLDMIGLVIDENGNVPVFTPDGHYISQDCRHFTQGGAKWYSQLIEWDKYLDVSNNGSYKNSNRRRGNY